MVKCSLVTILEIFEAIKDGKTIQCQCTGANGRKAGIQAWYDIIPDRNETLESRIINLLDNSCTLRVKPEPRLRPWTISETPELLWIAPKNHHDDIYLVTRKKDAGVETTHHYGVETICYERLLSDFDWRDGKGWKSCGTEVI